MAVSPLGAARARRRLTIEEAAARAELDPEAVRSLEESRVYRFDSPNAALAATLVYATALGISRREARELAGLPVGSSLLEKLTPGRLLAALTFVAACVAIAWFIVIPNLPARDVPVATALPALPPAAETQAAESLPQPWEIQVDVYNGTKRANAASLMANQVAGLAYRTGTVAQAPRTDYPVTRVYFPPGAEAIAERLAAQLGVKTEALPGGDDPLRLVVIVGTS